MGGGGGGGIQFLKAREGSIEIKNAGLRLSFMIVKQELFHFALNATTLLMSRLSLLLSFFLFLLKKKCYLCDALNISCYVDKAVKISLISFPFQDLFLSTLFSVSK
jgi:hypothetical protein